jgi:hypothetical protein
MRPSRCRLGRTERKNCKCDFLLPDPTSHLWWSGALLYTQDDTTGHHDFISSVSVSVDTAWYGNGRAPTVTPLKWAVFILRSGLAPGPPGQLAAPSIDQIFNGVIPKSDVLCCGCNGTNPSDPMHFPVAAVLQSYDKVCIACWFDQHFEYDNLVCAACFAVAFSLRLK